MSERILAIGDIHGCLSQLDALLAAINPGSTDHLIFLGDYVDRGPDSAGVLRRVIQLSQRVHVTALMGNHDALMLTARKSNDDAALWLRFGGSAVLSSYGIDQYSLDRIPEDHWQFLESLKTYFETDSHIFVHAGLEPAKPATRQPISTLLWATCHNQQPHISGKTIICGHSVQADGKVFHRGHVICIDTGAGMNGPLTCLDVGGSRVWQALPNGEVINSELARN